MKRKNNLKGFTLVEMIVSMVIVSFLSGVIYVTFLQGTRLWRYSMRERPEWQMDLFFDKLSGQLRNAFPCKAPPLQGSESSLEFCTMGPRRETGKTGEQTVRLPMGVRYFFDASKKTLFMTPEIYQQVLHPRSAGGVPEPVLERIDQFQMEYYLKDEQKKEWSWKRKWSRPCLPRAVKVSIDYGGMRKKKVTRFLPLMASGSCV